MVKKYAYLVVVALAALSLGSCSSSKGAGAVGGSSAPLGLAGLIGNEQPVTSVLTTLISQSTKLDKKAIEGTWMYVSPASQFESESLLAQAGGEAAALAIDNKLAELNNKIGITRGSCEFTFAQDNSCLIAFGGRQLAGTYTLNTKTHQIDITASLGLMHFSAKIYRTPQGITMLFDSSKLLDYAKAVAMFAGHANQNVQLVGDLLQHYDGLLLGMNLIRR